MKFQIKKIAATVPARFLTSALVAIAVFGLIAYNEISYRQSAIALVDFRSEVETQGVLRELQLTALNAETGQRGYLLTGREEYLEPYQAAINQTNTYLNRLREATRDKPHQLGTFAKFSRAYSRKLAELEMTIGFKKQGNEAAWQSVLDSGFGRRYMDEMRSAGDELSGLLEADAMRSQEAIERTLFSSRLVIGVIALLLLIGVALYIRQAEKMVKSEARAKMALREERDQLDKMVTDRTHTLSDLASHLTTVRETERDRLARELHDEMGSILTSVKLDLARLKQRTGEGDAEVMQRFDHIHRGVNEAIAMKRRVIEDLRPSALATLGLTSALEILVQETKGRVEFAIESSLEDIKLNPDCELTVYRMVQEALTNIAKYAQAKTVRITLHRYAKHVEVQVADDGVGFDAAQVKISAHGLLGMRLRIESHGGKLEIITALSKGCTLRANLPV